MTTDILLDGNKEPALQAGDFILGLSEEQHLELMLLSNKGDWKGDALLGIGYFNELNGADTQNMRDALEKNIREQLQYDDWTIGSISLPNIYNISINASKNE